jgi:hypothetical protein
MLALDFASSNRRHLLNPGAQQCREVGPLPPLLGQVDGDWRSSRVSRASERDISILSTDTAAALATELVNPRRATPMARKDFMIEQNDASSECC